MSYKTIEDAVREFQLQNYGPRYIGKSLRDMQFSEFHSRQVADWMKNPKHMLVILSGPGFGKTCLCSAMTEWILKTFNSARYHREEDLMKSLRTIIHEGMGDWAEALKYKIDDDLIILDDVGSWSNRGKVSEKDNSWKIEVFFAFLDERYNSMKPTIILSNLDKSDFNKIYSERVVSRLFATENTIISIGDDDYVDHRSLGK